MLAHIEVGARDHAAYGRARHDFFGFEINLCQARPVLTGLCGQPTKTEVVSITVNLTNAGHQVVQVGFCHFVDRVVTGAIFSSAVLPALALMANLPGGNNVFPFNTRCTIGIFTRDVTAAFKVDAVASVFAATIKLG